MKFTALWFTALLAACSSSVYVTQEEQESATACAPQPDLKAFSCTSDEVCGLHKCDLVKRVCQWPCGCDSDCQPGSHCEAPYCMPGVGDAGAD